MEDSGEDLEDEEIREMISDRNENCIGNWRKGHPCYEVTKSLAVIGPYSGLI